MGKVLNNAVPMVIVFITLSIVLFVGIIVDGNLVDNSGFDEGSALSNTSNAILLNFTEGVSTFSTYFNIWFILGAVGILVALAFGLVRIVQKSSTSGEAA